MATKLRSLGVFVTLLSVAIILTGCLGSGTKTNLISQNEIEKFLTAFTEALSTGNATDLAALHSFPLQTPLWMDEELGNEIDEDDFIKLLEEDFLFEFETELVFSNSKIYTAADGSSILEFTLQIRLHSEEDDVSTQNIYLRYSVKKEDGKLKLAEPFFSSLFIL